MSNRFVRHATHPRVQRAAVSAAIIVAATLAVVILNTAGLPTRAAAEPLQSVSASSDLASASASAGVSDRQLIGDATAARTPVAATASAASTSSTPATPSIRTLDIWTTGFQTQINECRGGVDVTAHYGTRAVAEHWQCGGDFFPTTAGTVVTFTGLDAGTYRVVGVVAVLNAYTAHTSQIPRGYSMLLQTCRNGDSHTTEFIGLQKIG